MADTFTTLWNRLLLRSPAVGAALAQDLIRDSFQQFAERREWSWLQKTSSFYPPALYNIGTVTVTEGLSTVTGVGTVFTPAMVGRQFRIALYPIYTILQYNGGTSLTLDRPWAGPTLAGQNYRIYQCYFTTPSDFQYFYSVTNPVSNYRLWHNSSQSQLDRADPQRTNSGQAFAVAFLDYTKVYNGTVADALQVRGVGPSPISTTSYGYSFPADSIYVVEIDTAGAVGAATFKWKKDSGAYTTLVVTDLAPLDLSNGVQVYFPAGNYVLGDTFVVRCTASSQSVSPRYELWPQPINAQYVYPFTYLAKWPRLTDDAPTLPPFISERGDAILEMALVACARFPGPDGEHKNPYFNPALALQHRASAELLIYELEKKDDDTALKDLNYENMTYAPAPWMDGSWQQVHGPISGW